MPSSSEKQRKFMGAELARARGGQKTDTGMSPEQLSDFAKKPVVHKPKEHGRGVTSKHAPFGRKPNPRGGY